MPVLRGSVTFRRFTAEALGERAKDVRRWAQRSLKRRAFEPVDRAGEEDRAAGWVEVEHVDGVEFGAADVIFGEQLLITYRVDRLRVPANVLRAELESWSRAYQDEHGFPPKRSEKKKQKELITKKLRNRVFPSTRTYDVSWNLQTDEVAIWTAGAKLVEEIQLFFEETFEARLHPMTPGVLAEKLEVSSATLAPTPELIGAIAGDITSAAARLERAE